NRRDLFSSLFALALAVDVATLVLLRGRGGLITWSLISQGVLYLRWPAAVAIAGAAAATLFGARAVDVGGLRLLVEGVTWRAGTASVMAASHLVRKERLARAEVERLAGALAAANERLRRYAASVEALATMEERNRIAREIHDGLGHYLTAAHAQLAAAEATLA